MAPPNRTQLLAKIEKALGEKNKRNALYTAMKRGRDNRHKAVAALPGGDAFRKEVRAIKLRCLEKQDELVERFAEKVRQRGAAVFLAQDAKAAASRSTWLRGKDPCSNPGRKANSADRAMRRTASPIWRRRRSLRR